MSLPASVPPAVDSIEALAGGTPVVRLARMGPPAGATVFLKLGAQNPTGSEKDAWAVAWMRQAERSGPLSHLVVPTSGNLGVSLAWLCAARKMKATVVMPDGASLERRALLRAYGAEVVLVPVEEGFEAVRKRAEALHTALAGSTLVDVFGESAKAFGPLVAQGYGEELVASAQADAASIDALVLGVGSGLSLQGAATAVRKAFPRCLVVAVRPEAEGPHRLQGLTTLKPDEANLPADRVERVSDAEARELQRRLGREEGLLAGISTGAVLAVSFRVAATLPRTARLYAGSIDTGERDFSLEDLFR